MEEEKFSTAFRASPLMLSITTLDGKFVDVNQAFCEMVGYSREEIIGKTATDLEFISAQEREKLVAAIESGGGSVSNAEVRFQVRNGSHRDILYSLEPISLQGVPHRLSTGVDITRRKRVEEELRKSQDSLQRAQTLAGMGSWELDPETDRGEWSPEMFHILGCDPELGPPTLEEFIAMLHPDDVQEVLATHQKALHTDEVLSVEFRLNPQHGTIRYITGLINREKGDDSNIILVGTIQDITERKQAEEALHQSEAHYRLLFEYVPEGILIADSESYYLDANPMMCTMLGYTRQELIGMHASDIVAPQEIPQIDPALEQIKTTSAHFRVWRFQRRDGSVFSAEVRVTPMPDGNLLALVCDITERIEADAALKESEERFRATFEQAAVGVAHVRPDGRWLRVNQKLCDIVGYSREELLERTFQDLTHPDDLEDDLGGTRQLLAGQTQVHAKEKRYLHKDGSTIWINLTSSLICTPSGEPDYFISVIQDITQRKNLEEQYRQAQKMEAVGQLTAGIAHDFNNLLTSINGFAELVQLQLSPNDPLNKMVGRILTSGQRAASLVSQLMAFSRKQIINPKVLDLNEVVKHIDKMLQRIIGEHIDLQTTLSPELWPVEVDPTQFEQVIVNLAVNARDAMPDGGSLIIETTNTVLDERYAATHFQVEAGEYVQLSVSDTGIGISKEVQDRIFEPFFTTKAVGQGTGLGLATIYGIVKQNKGSVWVYSEVGQGTTFKIYLPRTEEAGPVPVHSEAPIEIPTGNETILLVEDEEQVRNLIAEVLQMQGYTVLEARDGREALQLVAQHRDTIDLLLTDVVMPGTGGKVLADQLSRSQPKLKVLYMSGYTDAAIVHHGVLDSGVAFLQKPFTPRALARKVRAVLNE